MHSSSNSEQPETSEGAVLVSLATWLAVEAGGQIFAQIHLKIVTGLSLPVKKSVIVILRAHKVVVRLSASRGSPAAPGTLLWWPSSRR